MLKTKLKPKQTKQKNPQSEAFTQICVGPTAWVASVAGEANLPSLKNSMVKQKSEEAVWLLLR